MVCSLAGTLAAGRRRGAGDIIDHVDAARGLAGPPGGQPRACTWHAGMGGAPDSRTGACEASGPPDRSGAEAT